MTIGQKYYLLYFKVCLTWGEAGAGEDVLTQLRQSRIFDQLYVKYV